MWGSLFAAAGVAVAIYGAYRAVKYAADQIPNLEVMETIKSAGRKIQSAGKEASETVKEQSKMTSRERSGEMTAKEKREAPIRKAAEAAKAVGLPLGTESVKRRLTDEEKRALESVPGAIGVINGDGVIVRGE